MNNNENQIKFNYIDDETVIEIETEDDDEINWPNESQVERDNEDNVAYRDQVWWLARGTDCLFVASLRIPHESPSPHTCNIALELRVQVFVSTFFLWAGPCKAHKQTYSLTSINLKEFIMNQNHIST